MEWLYGMGKNSLFRYLGLRKQKEWKSNTYFIWSFDRGGPKTKKNDRVSKSELNVKKNMLSSLSIPRILFLLFGGFFRFLFDFFLLQGPPLLFLQNLYKICLLPAIFILSKQSENLYVLHKIWLCLRIRHRFDISPAVPKL